MPPSVSIIVPAYNEEATIGSLLEAVATQTYPQPQLEVVIADGFSQDGTRAEIDSFQRAHPALRVRVVDNPRRTIPSGLNRAIAATRGEVIIRLDAHSIPIPQYVERCVSAIEGGKGSVVGGVWEIRPGAAGWIAGGIAQAAAHPMGAGDAGYRLGAQAGAVDTVPFGAFRRDLTEEVGCFDESLLTNEDYEFNTRVRRQGGVIWLDPAIRSTYIARSTLASLARQYWRYGFWKFRMLRRYPTSLRWRQALPPLFVITLITGIISSLFFPIARILLLAEIILYVASLTAAGLRAAIIQRRPLLAGGFVLAIATMHLAWGGGFLWSLAQTSGEQHG
jgi:succinoglycan biosynthesis protein ExoA